MLLLKNSVLIDRADAALIDVAYSPTCEFPVSIKIDERERNGQLIRSGTRLGN